MTNAILREIVDRLDLSVTACVHAVVTWQVSDSIRISALPTAEDDLEETLGSACMKRATSGGRARAVPGGMARKVTL
jgi:hypothetical protein